MTVPTPENPMLLFGCGNMGRAMLSGWLAAGFDPAAFLVVDPFAADLPVRTVNDGAALDCQFSLAMLGIKPQIFADAAPLIDALLMPDATVVSILAGTRLAALQRALPGRTIFRLMPNLAAALGKSPLCLYPHSTHLEALLAPLGTIFPIADEDQMDAVTALAGSGPAFVYRFIDAMAKAGIKLGLDPALSGELALVMTEGAALLAAASDEHPDALARRVTSPGGTTAAGLAVLDSNEALEQLIAATLAAARDRGLSLSQ